MLDNTSAVIHEERNSRKQPLDDASATELLQSSQRVSIARGKKIRELDASETNLDDLKGPTGNYRAPIVRVGDRLLVGFHPETLEEMISAS